MTKGIQQFFPIMRSRTVVFLLSFFICVSIQGQEQSQTILQYITSIDDRLKITLYTDYKKLLRKSLKEEYQESKFVMNDQKGNELINLEGRIRSRGNTRKKVCLIPPVKFDFEATDLLQYNLDTLDNLKFVFPCKTRDTDQERLYREFFLYELYQIIDPNAMRVKLVDVTFIHENEEKASFTSFLVEDEDEYARRMNASVIESGRIHTSIFERTSFLKMTFFQFMIGNSDWAIKPRHNIEIVKLNETNQVVAVPYDFDYTGLVDQFYATPHESLPIKSVRDRYYHPYEISDEEFDQMVGYYSSIEEEVFQLLKGRDYMNEKTKSSCQKYLEEFFEMLEKPNRLRKKIVK